MGHPTSDTRHSMLLKVQRKHSRTLQSHRKPRYLAVPCLVATQRALADVSGTGEPVVRSLARLPAVRGAHLFALYAESSISRSDPERVSYTLCAARGASVRTCDNERWTAAAGPYEVTPPPHSLPFGLIRRHRAEQSIT